MTDAAIPSASPGGAAVPPPTGEAGQLRTELFDYALPNDLIAQAPVEPRDSARLLVLERASGGLSHRVFHNLAEILRPGDLLVANRTRVLPARLVGKRIPSGGRVEALLLARAGDREWHALVHPGRRLPPGARVAFDGEGRSIVVEIGERLPSGGRVLHVQARGATADDLPALGRAPLPPYIRGWSGDPERYQTVYGDQLGSAAAPTAGLHFTPGLLGRLRDRGIETRFLTLHVGVDTFRPIRSERIDEHEMHAEWAEVPGEIVEAIAETRARNARVVAVGTTTVRALESAAVFGSAAGWSGETRLFIAPGHRFRYVDAMITNFHLPRSTLLVLVSAFAGREAVLAAYCEAVRRRYRFYSFGDAMLLL